jgi:hypothetical protein
VWGVGSQICFPTVTYFMTDSSFCMGLRGVEHRGQVTRGCVVSVATTPHRTERGAILSKNHPGPHDAKYCENFLRAQDVTNFEYGGSTAVLALSNSHFPQLSNCPEFHSLGGATITSLSRWKLSYFDLSIVKP